MDADSDQRLSVRLDAPLPREIAVGRGTALFVCGSCFDRQARIDSLSFVVGDAEQPVSQHGMTRLDLFRSLHPGLDPFATRGVSSDPASAEDPSLHSYLSGFWGIVEIAAGTGPTCGLALRARLAGGGEATVGLASLVVRERAPAPAVAPRPHSQDGLLVVICMATYEPPPELFRRQIESIRQQTHRNWICVISDDGSSPARFAELEAELSGDPRFLVSRSSRRLGFYLNFERALSLAPVNADYVAFADQDDFWYPDKLRTLLSAIGDAQLVYSDARVIDREANVVSDTYWTTRRNNHSDFLSLLMTNAVTGAASLFRRELLDYALPFPPPQFAHFHDHWVAVLALALGRIEFVEQPLYDYVQHHGATLGHVAANWMPPLRSRLRSLRRDPRERVVLWRHHYFIDVCRLTVWATIIRIRCAADMTPDKRHALDRFLGLDSSLLDLADLWRRGARELLGRHSETLGAEWMLAYAFTWRRLLRASVRERPARHLRLDAVPPPELVVTPGRRAPAYRSVDAISAKLAGLELEVSDQAPERVNLLIPTIDLDHFFGGYIGKLNLARRLADRGLRVRLVTVDPVGAVPLDWRRSVERYDGLEGLFDRVEVAFGREAAPLEVSRADRFVATTWWTAHIADEALAALCRDGDGFLYLIQEYEPFTFAMGSYAALAAGSYQLPHRALFSTELLRGYFRHHGLGVYAAGVAAGDAASAAFENAITAVAPPSASELRDRGTRRLLFYARPESHASRNMFELGLLALQRAARQSAFAGGWELHGIGTVEGERTLSLGGGLSLQVLPRSDQASYAALLREHDLGLALMYTPHPSLVPIEMASAGMLTITNSFENKTPEAMTQISTNLLAAAPAVGEIAAALCRAAARIDDYEARARGAAVNWSRTWNESFSDELLTRIIGMLDR